MNNNAVAVQKKNLMNLISEKDLSAVESALALNDLSKLTTEQRISYYNAVCESVGLNPLTQPFAYIILDGKLTLYARKECSEQLRKKNSVSTQILSKGLDGDFYEVHVRASDSSGRIEEDFATIFLKDKYGKDLAGVNLANAKMKCVTKAKRRVTLAISGLGMMDETELETIKDKISIAENPQIQNQFKSAIQIANATEKTVDLKPSDEITPEQAGEYIIEFGKKLKGKKISEVAPHEHESMIKWLRGEAEKTNRQIQGHALMYIEMAEKYMQISELEAEPELDKEEVLS